MGSMKYLAEELENTPDLGKVQAALVRERVIRNTMAQTGEGRSTVVDMVDALESMDQEAVLDLTEGEPTTLVDALRRYVAELEARDPDGDELTPVARVTGELRAILAYPWPEEEALVSLHNPHYGLALHVVQQEYDRTEIRMGNNRHLVANVHHSGDSADAVSETAEAVYRATLARVIADREHIVSVNPRDRLDFLRFVDRPNGSWSAKDSRLTVEAVAGGGLLIRTRPFSFQADSQLSKHG